MKEKVWEDEVQPSRTKSRSKFRKKKKEKKVQPSRSKFRRKSLGG